MSKSDEAIIEWPQTVIVDGDVRQLSDYEEALWIKYHEELDLLQPQQLTLLLADGSVLPGFLVYGEEPNLRELPKGFFCYAIRHSDDGEMDPISIADMVRVNRLGWLLTKFRKPGEGEIEVVDWNFLD